MKPLPPVRRVLYGIVRTGVVGKMEWNCMRMGKVWGYSVRYSDDVTTSK